ncbi:hypothetical protein GCM10023231_40400 [Olivibacter ginsenosidimutans]|uniref:AB hydrolase-1 domain-containing protein n=2 Tax=Olivibacter ginsenosidimutans TaxID=1176537 RepID=A0ABP9CD99_9SPHI
MAKVKNLIIKGSDDKPIALDIFFNETHEQQPVIIYAHGFNGFKDWGNFDLIAEQFLASGFTFVKFNFSHNGTTPDTPEDFTDLEGFGENNYTKQLYDLGLVIDWVQHPANSLRYGIDKERIGLVGHSMGGGICILKTAEDSRIKALVTWAAIGACKTPWGGWSKEKMMEWKQSGVAYYTNSRTRQEMPLHYQLYEDYLLHDKQLDIPKAAATLPIPWLLCHGTEDTTVPVKVAYQFAAANPKATLLTVSSDHVFGRKHPWNPLEQPIPMQEVINKNILFFKQHL